MQDASLNAGTMQRNARRPCGLLVDRQSLLREGIKLVLEAIGYRIEAEAERASAALSDPDCSDKYDFIVATLRPDDADLDAIRALRQSWPRARLIIFADTASNPTLMIKSFEAGADGCVLLDIKPDVLRQSLDLIMLGERVFPSALLLKHLSQGDRNAKQGDAPHLQSSFSARDDEILGCLAKGYSNKMIAKSVGITEAATKAHLKAILQKIGAVNRTQAAIWAINRGLGGKTMSEAPATMSLPASLAAGRRLPFLAPQE